MTAGAWLQTPPLQVPFVVSPSPRCDRGHDRPVETLSPGHSTSPPIASGRLASSGRSSGRTDDANGYFQIQVLGLCQRGPEGLFHLLHRGETFEALVDPAAGVQHEYPGFVEPTGDGGKPPLIGMVYQSRLAQIALDLAGIVIIFDVDEVGLLLMGLFQFRNGVYLGAAGWAGAEGGGGENHHRGQVSLDRLVDGQLVQVQVRGVIGGEVFNVGYRGQRLVSRRRRHFADVWNSRFLRNFHIQCRLHWSCLVFSDDVQTPISGLGKIQFGAVSAPNAIGPGMELGLPGFGFQPSGVSTEKNGCNFSRRRIYQALGTHQQKGHSLGAHPQHGGSQDRIDAGFACSPRTWTVGTSPGPGCNRW